jgi:hypothetical protein
MTIITPYDNKIGVWYHKGQTVRERTIDELAQNIVRLAPAVRQVFVKTSDGPFWMAQYDTKTAMRINGPDSIANWVETLQKYGLEFHAWCVPQGLDIEGESQRIIQACQVPGVRSMILDVEPYKGFFTGGRGAVRPLMSKVRAALPGAYHIAMTVDPRPQHYRSVFPDEWFPFVGSVHLQLYWNTFAQTAEKTLADGFKTWAGFKRPLFAILPNQTISLSAAAIDAGRALAINTYKSPGLSYWMLNSNSADTLPKMNETMANVVPPPPPGSNGEPVTFGASVVVGPNLPGYSDGVFDGAEPGTGTFTSYVGYGGGVGKYHPSNDHVANVWARYDPALRQSGWYRIEAFIPNLHATVGNARYKLHGVRGEPSEIIISLPQAQFNNEWVLLGTFYIDTQKAQPGVVYLNDWTFEPGREIAFDALRWRPILEPNQLQVISNVGHTTREILMKGKALGNRAGVFARVGDSISASPNFLTPLGRPGHNLGAYQAELGPTLAQLSQTEARPGFGNSFVCPPLAAGNGWGADRLLQVGFGNPSLCANETPLLCEYKQTRPFAALIMIGTNDSGGVAPETYTLNLRRIIEQTIAQGVVPILSTIPPKRLGAWHTERVTTWNDIIRSLARQFEIPLWDYWFMLQGLPNQGLDSDGVHPNSPPDGQTGRFDEANLRFGYTARNLGALLALRDVLRLANG